MFRRPKFLTILITSALLYFGAMAAPTLSEHASRTDTTLARR